MKKYIDHFDLSEIAGSGQCFRWKETASGCVRVTAFGRVLNMRACDGEPGYFELDCSEEDWESVWTP